MRCTRLGQSQLHWHNTAQITQHRQHVAAKTLKRLKYTRVTIQFGHLLDIRARCALQRVAALAQLQDTEADPGRSNPVARIADDVIPEDFSSSACSHDSGEAYHHFTGAYQAYFDRLGSELHYHEEGGAVQYYEDELGQQYYVDAADGKLYYIDGREVEEGEYYEEDGYYYFSDDPARGDVQQRRHDEASSCQEPATSSGEEPRPLSGELDAAFTAATLKGLPPSVDEPDRFVSPSPATAVQPPVESAPTAEATDEEQYHLERSVQTSDLRSGDEAGSISVSADLFHTSPATLLATPHYGVGRTQARSPPADWLAEVERSMSLPPLPGLAGHTAFASAPTAASPLASIRTQGDSRAAAPASQHPQLLPDQRQSVIDDRSQAAGPSTADVVDGGALVSAGAHAGLSAGLLASEDVLPGSSHERQRLLEEARVRSEEVMRAMRRVEPLPPLAVRNVGPRLVDVRLFETLQNSQEVLSKKMQEQALYIQVLEEQQERQNSVLAAAHDTLEKLVAEVGNISRLAQNAAAAVRFSVDKGEPEEKLMQVSERMKVLQSLLSKEVGDMHQGIYRPVPVFWSGVAGQVRVMGDFDEWTQGLELNQELAADSVLGYFEGELMLLPGMYRIKFLVDDEWRLAPDWPTEFDPHTKEYNNVLLVEPDSYILTRSRLAEERKRQRALEEAPAQKVDVDDDGRPRPPGGSGGNKDGSAPAEGPAAGDVHTWWDVARRPG